MREVALEAIARARRGEGPTLIECETYRYRCVWVLRDAKGAGRVGARQFCVCMHARVTRPALSACVAIDTCGVNQWWDMDLWPGCRTVE